MKITTTILIRFGFGALLLAGCLSATGCSLMLDPTYCESNAECEDGVCSNGVCVSSEASTIDMMMSDMGATGSDARVATDGSAGQDAAILDAAAEPDMQADMRTMNPPECDISVEQTLTNQPDIEVSISITDADDSSETISATLNGEEVTLNRMLTYRGFVNLDEGQNTITLVAIDRDEQRCEKSIEVISDRTAPVIDMLDPADGDDVLTNEQELTVRGSVAELNFDQSLTILVDDRVFEPEAPIEWANGMFLFRIPLEETSIDVELVATDRVGNESDPVGFRVESDLVPPVVTLQSPIEGEELTVSQRRYMVRGTVEDNNRVVRNPRVVILVTSEGAEDRQYDMPASGVDGSFSQFVELTNGLNTIQACGLDDAGNEHCAEGRVVKNAPCLNLESPLEGDFVGSLLVRLTGTVCAGVDSVEAAVDGGPSSAGAVEGDRFDVEVRALQAGDHQIVITVRNSDGDSAEQTVNIGIDPSAPNLQLLAPNDGVCVSGSVEVSGQAQDDRSGIREVRINATPVDSLDLGGGFRQDVPVLDGDDFELRVVAVNGAGLETERVVTVRGDSIAAIARFDIMNPLMPVNPWLAPNGAGRIRLSGRIDSGTCGLSQAGFTIDDLPVGVMQGRFESERAYEHGQRSVRWEATDLAGNVGQGDYAFRVDSLAPTIHVTSPTNGVYQSGDTVEVTATLDDVGSGLRLVRINDQVVVPELGVNGYVAQTEVVGLAEGANTIRVEATDEVGNVTVVERVVNRDITPVDIAITHPAVGVAVPIPLTVTGVANDGEIGSGVESITVNGMVAEYNPGSGTWTARDVVVSAEAPQLVITAIDRAGNQLPEPLTLDVPVESYGRQSQALDGFTVASSVGWLLAVDANLDGLPDVIALSDTDEGVSATYVQVQEGEFVGRGPGASGIPEEFGFSAAVFGDVNVDGRLDLVATGDGGSYFLTGMGNGSFMAGEVALPALQGVTCPILADINRDSRLDLILMGDGDTRLYFGDRDTTLAAEDIAEFGLDSLSQFGCATGQDVDGDGVIDIVAAGLDGSHLWIGDRDEFSFTSADAVGLGHGPDANATDLLWLDMNQDGILDLLTLGTAGARAYIADDEGLFTLVDRGLDWRATDRAAAIADLDGDGRTDLVVGGSEGLRLWRSADAGFELMNTPLPFAGEVEAIAAADIDLDGDVDLLIGTDSGVHLIRSNRAQLNPDSRHLHLNVVRHQLPPNNGDNLSADGVGALVYIQFVTQEELDDPQLGAAPFEPTQALRANPAGATLITLGEAAGARIKVHYVDLGGRGSNTRSFLTGIPAGRAVTSYARE